MGSAFCRARLHRETSKSDPRITRNSLKAFVCFVCFVNFVDRFYRLPRCYTFRQNESQNRSYIHWRSVVPLHHWLPDRTCAFAKRETVRLERQSRISRAG